MVDPHHADPTVIAMLDLLMSVAQVRLYLEIVPTLGADLERGGHWELVRIDWSIGGFPVI